jgi:hypothetical protein
MDNILYDALSSYYHALEQKGYMANSHAQRLMLLIFYRDFTLKDYRGLLSKDDYHLIEKALDCLWGSSCLIPYPDYLKMGRLHLGETTELAQRLRNLENEPVLKVMHSMDGQDDPDSDIMIVEEDED